MSRKLIVFLLSIFIFNICQARPNFELVESVPLNTIYGQPGVRRTEQVWLDMINSAQHSISLGAFYFAIKKNGGPMSEIIAALKNAATHGIKVRIILDESFFKRSVPAIKPLLHQKNIKIRVLPMKLIAGGVMHAKYLVVDQQDSYVGSANFDWKALDQIHEIGVHIYSKRLAETILRVFNLDWALCRTRSIAAHMNLLYKPYSFMPVTDERPILLKSGVENLVAHAAFSPKIVLPSSLDWEQDQFVKLLDNAHYQVLMQVLTYSPGEGFGRKGYWAALDNAIRRAAARGVKVKLIVSNWTQKSPMINYLKSLSLVPNIEIKIGTVPPYANKFIPFARVEHCKYFVVDDDLSWIGTGNWQWSYFHDTRDIAIIINGKAPNKQLQQIFFRDWNGPYTRFIDVNKKYSMPKRV